MGFEQFQHLYPQAVPLGLGDYHQSQSSPKVHKRQEVTSLYLTTSVC